jgi:anti-sigma B factor antagonist
LTALEKLMENSILNNIRDTTAEEQMKIKIEEKDGVTIVFIDGNVLQENVPIFRVKLLELLEENKNRIVLDMIACNYISSMCLAAIVDVKKKVSAKKGDIKMARVNKLVVNLLETTNLMKHLEVYENVSDAVESFFAGSKI